MYRGDGVWELTDQEPICTKIYIKICDILNNFAWDNKEEIDTRIHNLFVKFQENLDTNDELMDHIHRQFGHLMITHKPMVIDSKRSDPLSLKQ